MATHESVAEQFEEHRAHVRAVETSLLVGFGCRAVVQRQVQLGSSGKARHLAA